MKRRSGRISGRPHLPYLLVIVFLGVACFVLLTFAVPRLREIFMRSKSHCHCPRRICMSLYQFLIGYWYGIAVIHHHRLPLLILYLRTDQGRYIQGGTR